MSRAGMPFSQPYRIRGNYRKQELLLSTIPNDEVKRMSNGRWVCTVCSRRPVLDTLETLQIHRGGKKHKEEIEYIQNLKQEKKNEEEIKNIVSLQPRAIKRKMPPVGPPSGRLPKKPKYQNEEIHTPEGEPKNGNTMSQQYVDSKNRNKVVGYYQNNEHHFVASPSHPNTPHLHGPSPQYRGYGPMAGAGGGKLYKGPEAGAGGTWNGDPEAGVGETWNRDPRVGAGGTYNGDPGVAAEGSWCYWEDTFGGRENKDYFVKLREKGWLLDGEGKLYKDQNVEWDSDEEEE